MGEQLSITASWKNRFLINGESHVFKFNNNTSSWWEIFLLFGFIKSPFIFVHIINSPSTCCTHTQLHHTCAWYQCLRVVTDFLLSSLAVPRLIELCRSPTERNNSDSVLVACLVGVFLYMYEDMKTFTHESFKLPVPAVKTWRQL